MQPVGLQEWIHKIEEGEGTKYLRVVFVFLALLGLTAIWHLREAKNFRTAEAMDAAQLARNIADGNGFTTQFVRPLSITLLEAKKGSGPSPELFRDGVPDISNAPLYPVLLAAVFKVAPVDWEISTPRFWRHQPEWIIGGLNQLFFFGALALVFRICARLFDRTVGFLAVVVMALTELYWEFATSGLSTMLLIVLFLWLVNVLISFEAGVREGARSKGWQLGMAAYAGAIVGLMALTRYSMGWFIIPVAIYLGAIVTSGRGQLAATAIAVTALLLAPWLFRNYNLSGTLFGTAGFAIHHGTSAFPGQMLERSMPKDIRLELNKVDLEQYPRKLFVNGRTILADELPMSAGSWIAALTLGAMLIQFRNPALARLKYFFLGTLFLLVLVQALGRTSLSQEMPVFNSENLVVIISPLFFIFGCGLFYILLDQIEFVAPWLRTMVILGFVFVLALPLTFKLLPPREAPVAYPPYWPPGIQEIARWMDPKELMMSDMPWAVAWYGNRQCVWTTLATGNNNRDDFYSINDDRKPIKGLLLTDITTDKKFVSEMRPDFRGPHEGVWARFYLDAVLMKLPNGFPLKVAPPGLLPHQLFLSDRIRWPE